MWTGVQTCALPIWRQMGHHYPAVGLEHRRQQPVHAHELGVVEKGETTGGGENEIEASAERRRRQILGAPEPQLEPPTLLFRCAPRSRGAQHAGRSVTAGGVPSPGEKTRQVIAGATMKVE